MTRPLFEISDDLAALHDLLVEIGGDVTDEELAAAVDEWITNLDGELTEKVDNYAAVIADLNARADVWAENAARLAAKAKTVSNRADWLKSKLLCVLQMRGIRKVDGHRFTVSVRKNGGALPVDIYDPQLVPRDLCRHIPEEWRPDKSLILEALAEDEEVPGVIVSERGEHLRIS